MTDTNTDWLIFFAILLLLAIITFAAVVWLKVCRPTGLKLHHKHHKHHHHHQANPPLAEAGGPPPVRPPDQPPRGV
jgi:hypothetical protein